jgi:hypothetical protein
MTFVSSFNTYRITARGIVKYTIVTVFVGCLLLYIAFQARFLIVGPEITLLNEPDSVQNSPTVTLTGTARNIAKITLNGRQIFTDQSGYFSEALVLENGYTIATITAIDRYGRETNVVRSFVYTPTSIMTK